MIDKKQIIVVAAALFLAAAPAFAQHSHGGAAGGAGGSHGAAMSNGAADHGSPDSSAKGTSSSPTTLLTKNTKLDNNLTTKLQSKGLLPAGTDLKDACAGFKNLGQCVAAIHVNNNLKVPFACMKANMTGAAPAAATTCPAGTGSGKMSLGKSIQALAPTADSKTASKTATTQADADIKEAKTTS
ncbi:MAG TPA: hypothetical protein VNY24_16980 [Candidatus Acidoferrales bacterium]|jgi:hypothetical protein|nr:hypothetical protein [Candidatus Acidoferrales bacterium]